MAVLARRHWGHGRCAPATPSVDSGCTHAVYTATAPLDLHTDGGQEVTGERDESSRPDLQSQPVSSGEGGLA